MINQNHTKSELFKVSELEEKKKKKNDSFNCFLFKIFWFDLFKAQFFIAGITDKMINIY